jgi:DNA invertase Pin-like site-specific DNA recombinase
MAGMTTSMMEDFKMVVACYVRVSTRHQKDDGQRAEIQKWLDANGIDPKKVEWYADKESGTTMKRPEFDRLLADIFHGKVKTVVLWKLDRLSRRLKDGVTTLAEWSERGLRVVVVTQQLDFNGSVGRMIAALLLGLAEIENEFRRERQAAGIAVAKKHGKYKGRANGTLKGNPGRVVELRDKGLTAPEISTVLGISLRTVWRYMGRGQNGPVKA